MTRYKVAIKEQAQKDRRITQKHRLIYEIIDKEVVVLVLTAYGHYNDK